MLRIAAISLIIFIALSTSCLSETFTATGTIDTYFSPRGEATEAIVKEINSAQSEISWIKRIPLPASQLQKLWWIDK